ncbi:MAG: hypothetical protein AB8F34_08555 [Akkermansiaceae bacterium]
MHKLYTLIALVVFCYALRACRTAWLRKMGALLMLLASGLCIYFITESILWGIVAMAAWFLLPWVELLTRIRKMRMPVENKLENRFTTNLEAFPSAPRHLHNLEIAGYEHIRNCGWNMGGMEQVYQLFWNAETRTVVTLCLCEQSNVTFSYLTITSRDITDGVWRTTNFPFSPTLKPNPGIHWNQISCSNECVIKLIKSHCHFLLKQGFVDDDLAIPDPDNLEEEIEHEIKRQIDHNLQQGVISLTGDGHFRYTARGLFFLWRQFVRDMIRLC